MKANYTDITIVLDRSGSMDCVKDDTIGGVNQFLKSQQAVPGEATFSLVQFDNVIEDVVWGVPLGAAQPLTSETFVPRGSTALLDAIGQTIDRVGQSLAAMNEPERPDKVVFVIVTDGLENASSVFTRHKIDGMIAHQRDQYQWQFLFLGANQDAIATAASLNISAESALTYSGTPLGTKSAFGQRKGGQRKGGKEKGTFYFSPSLSSRSASSNNDRPASCFFGRPRGRRLDSNPNSLAAFAIHGIVPNGRPRCTHSRRHLTSASVWGSFTYLCQSSGRRTVHASSFGRTPSCKAARLDHRQSSACATRFARSALRST